MTFKQIAKENGLHVVQFANGKQAKVNDDELEMLRNSRDPLAVSEGSEPEETPKKATRGRRAVSEGSE